jgi:hypothetical protein
MILFHLNQPRSFRGAAVEVQAARSTPKIITTLMKE